MTAPTSSGHLGDGDERSGPGPRGEDRPRFYRNIDFNNNYYFLIKEHRGDVALQFENVSCLFSHAEGLSAKSTNLLASGINSVVGLDQGLTHKYLKATATIPY
jgi:hypothetical protein